MFEKTFYFKGFSVVFRNNSITYKLPNGAEYGIVCFENSIGNASDGYRIRISYTDKRGSGMEFIHYEPSDLQGMFEFIARGYRFNLNIDANGK